VEHEQAIETWKSKAAMAVSKGRDDMAREALDRALSHGQMSQGFAQQLDDQRTETEALRSTFLKLQGKLAETRSRCDLLIAEHRRARVVGKAQEARSAAGLEKSTMSMDRFRSRIDAQRAKNHAGEALGTPESLEDRFALLEREHQIESLLQQLKGEQAEAEAPELTNGSGSHKALSA
jgi:phage shock protein A